MKRSLRKPVFLFAVAAVLLLCFASCSPKAGAGNALLPGGSDVVEDSESDGRKVITTVNMTVETDAYDDLIGTVTGKVKELGGYVQSMYENSDSYGRRYASITLRVPSEKSDEFLSSLGSSAYVRSQSITNNDVSMEYTDIESRLSALEAERERLEELFSAAGSVSDAVAVQERLTAVIQDIESLEVQLRDYDVLTEYTTVSMSISEVSVLQTDDMSVWEEIGFVFADNTARLLEFSRSMLVIVVGFAPFTLPVVVTVAAVLLIVRFTSRRRRNKKAGNTPQ